MTAMKRFSIRSHQPRVRPAQDRHGSVLIEFAIVSLALYLIIAAIMTFGQALFITECLQHTADTFAHELALTPLPPQDALSDALQDSTVMATLFNENDLLIDMTPWQTQPQYQSLTLDQYLQATSVPMINRLLAPMMITDLRSDGHTYLWYPGAVKGDDGHFYVSILNPSTPATPTTVPVIEAVGSPDPFSLGTVGGTTPTGLAGVRINYAFQSATLSAYTHSGNGSNVVNTPVTVTDENPDIGATRGGLYGGPDQLGQQWVGNNMVRPYQRLISAQAVYRREVFGP